MQVVQQAATRSAFHSGLVQTSVLSGGYTTRMLDNRNTRHLDEVAEMIAAGEVVAFGFDGIFAFVGDADQEIAARRMAMAKGQPLDKTLALVCPPEELGQFVDTQAPALRRFHDFGTLQQLQRDLHGLGLILPVASAEVPRYAQQDGTVLNVWFELPPDTPARYLDRQLRKLGVRAMVGTSANQHGEATYVDPAHAMRVFGGRIPAIVAHDLRAIPMHRRVSSTIVDFTGAAPMLARRGSVPLDELRAGMRRLGLADLEVAQALADHPPVPATLQ